MDIHMVDQAKKIMAKPILRRVEGDAWNLAAWSAVVIKIQSVVISDHWYNQPFQSLPPDKFNIPSGKLTVCDIENCHLYLIYSFLLTFTRSPWIPRRCRGWPGRQLLQKKLTEFEHVHQSSPGVQKRGRACAAERRQQGFDDVFLISFLERRSPCGMETLWKLRSVVGDLGGTSPTVRLELHLPGINNDW